MMESSSRLWFILQYIYIYVLMASSGASGQSSECDSLKTVFPQCSCSKNLDRVGAMLSTSVDCSSRGLNTIPSSTTRFYIHELKLNNNSIVSLGESILSNFDITKLDLSNNPIGSVHDHAFGYLGSHLKILILSGNNSSQPPKNAFQHLTLLEELTLQNYNVTLLTQSSAYFLSLGKLTQLTLDNWKLESIDPGSVQLPSSTRLQSLTLLNQVMVSLPVDELHLPELQYLKRLHISHTNIHEIPPGSLSSLNSLTELDLSDNKITSLDADCFTGVGDTLARLFLSNNQLTSISLLPGLADLTDLQELDLSFNQIISIPDLSRIHTTKPLALNLSHNGINVVPESAFVGIADKLKTIDLSYNRISTLQANFGSFTQIESLFLSYQSANSPLVLPSSLGQTAGTLKQLFVGGQKISEPDLWSVVRQLYMLEVLNLTSAQLTSIPNLSLSKLTHLKILDLSNNRVQNITQDTLVGPRNSLKFLILTGNSISTLSSCVLYQYTSYPISLFLGEDRLICDCSVEWLWSRIRNGSITHLPGQEAVCRDNQPLANKSMDSFCTSPSTEPQCIEYYNAPDLKLTISVEKMRPDTIQVSWQLSETSDLKQFIIQVSDSRSPSPVWESSVPASLTSQTVSKLVGNTNYQVCVEAYFNKTHPLSNCTHIFIPGNSTVSPEQQFIPGNSTVSPEQQTGLSPTEIGIIVGVIVGVVILLALIGAIVYLLVFRRCSKKKMPDGVPAPPRNFSKSELPSMNEETRTFAKPKRSRETNGPETREAMQVVAISDGQTGHGRVGRANLLNSDGSFKKTRTSNSSSSSGQVAYENDHGPLPPTPNRQHSMPPHVGYYNKGFKDDSYDEIVPKRESVI
ncbi:unnamed protein product [Candidula unifasciata]|uniref:Fibronectin type-III domain-containing protein n=1 Tax=Candidula unifasciata TaxID=100452 RepID=A0A8S3YMJ0_9EUPU|nr:unnamed protein product [Candidula unifasciata]